MTHSSATCQHAVCVYLQMNSFYGAAHSHAVRAALYDDDDDDDVH